LLASPSPALISNLPTPELVSLAQAAVCLIHSAELQPLDDATVIPSTCSTKFSLPPPLLLRC